MERATGIEPASEAWEAPVLPLNYARITSAFNRYVSNCSRYFSSLLKFNQKNTCTAIDKVND